MKKYDVVVVGAGPGGYIAAIRCAQLGLSTACVDARVNDDDKPTLGGTCLNVGCIPSKALLDSSHLFHQIEDKAGEHGINVDGAIIDINKMMSRKNRIIRSLTIGINSLFKKNKIDWYKGQGKLIGNKGVEVSPTHQAHDEKTIITASHIIIATGSNPAQLSLTNIDDDLIVDSTAALKFSDVPRRLGIIGAGVIGLELGSVWNRLGSEVTLFEAQTNFLPTIDRQIAKDFAKELKKQRLDIHLGTEVTTTVNNNLEVTVNYRDTKGEQIKAFDKLIVAIGRKPNTTGLGTRENKLKLDKSGFIIVDDQFRTNIENVYAIGDVVRGPMLAHKASEEGVAVAEIIAGKPGYMNYNHIPWVIYTWPEVAWVGKTEEQLKADHIEHKVGRFPFLASGRARAIGETNGFVKVLADAKTDRLLGVHILGPHASELISEAVLAMEFDSSAEDLARTIHAHPTLAEALHEAALEVDNRSFNM